jgi:transposase
VHRDSITAAVSGAAGTEPLRLEKLPNDTHRIRRFFERLTKDGEEIRCCYEASAAGYVLHRLPTSWGIRCDVIAPSLIPAPLAEAQQPWTLERDQRVRISSAGARGVFVVQTVGSGELVLVEVASGRMRSMCRPAQSPGLT